MTKVAIFETDHAFAVELRNELTRFGCTVQVFTDGTSGLNAAKSAPPDLILVSAELPPVNGFSTCNKIKKNAKLASVPIILMSSQSSPETFEQHRRLPSRADDYVHKPISFADFRPHIERLIVLQQNEHEIVDEDTGLVMDDEVLIVEDSQVAPALEAPSEEHASDDSPSSGDKPQSKRRPLELDIPEDGVAEPPTARRPLGGLARDETESLDEEFETIVGERPNIPEHLMDTYRQANSIGGRSSSLPPGTRPPMPSNAPGTWSTPPTASSPPGAPAPADLVRAKNALKTALGQLNQARKETASLRELLAASQAQGADSQRLRAELDKAKAAEREALDLREQLQSRDKELVSMRELAAAKEREVLAAKDGTLAVERSLAELNDRLAKLETENSASSARVEALLADKALADKRAADFKGGARKIAEQLNQRAKELAEAQQAHQATVDRLKREHEATLEQAEEKRRTELADVERTHREQLDRLKTSQKEKAGHAEETTKSKLESAHAKAIEKLERAKEAAEKKLEDAAKKAEQDRAKRAQDHASKLEAAKQAHQKEKEKLQKQIEDARLAATAAKDKTATSTVERQTLEKRHAAEIAQLEEAHKQELKALKSEHQQAVKKLQIESQQAVKKLQEELAAANASRDALVKEHSEELQKAGYNHQEKLLQTEKSFAAIKEQLEQDLAEGAREFDELKAQLQQATDAAQEERRAHDDRVATLTAEVSDLKAHLQKVEAELAELSPTTTQLTEKLKVAETKLDKARARWGKDRADLKQVKNNLAALVRTLDEAAALDLEE